MITADVCTRKDWSEIRSYIFNHRDIVKVVFSGFHDDDDKMMVDNINQWYMESPYERTDVEKLVRERGAQDGGKLG